MNTLTDEELKFAIKLGALKAISDVGLIPSQANEIINEYCLESKTAEGDPLSQIWKAVTTSLVAGVAVGTGLGAYAGKLHSDLNASAAGEGNPEELATERKINAYKKLKADLLLNQNANR